MNEVQAMKIKAARSSLESLIMEGLRHGICFFIVCDDVPGTRRSKRSDGSRDQSCAEIEGFES